jgi:hypothetical protein
MVVKKKIHDACKKCPGAKRMKDIRGLSGITQQAFADWLEVDVQEIRDVENCRKKWQTRLALKINEKLHSSHRPRHRAEGGLACWFGWFWISSRQTIPSNPSNRTIAGACPCQRMWARIGGV